MLEDHADNSNSAYFEVNLKSYVAILTFASQMETLADKFMENWSSIKPIHEIEIEPEKHINEKLEAVDNIENVKSKRIIKLKTLWKK